MENTESLEKKKEGSAVCPDSAPENGEAVEGKDGKKGNLIALLISFALAFICITIVSHCSFLYLFNDDVDANWYLSVGHGIIDGLVPYKDLFEQKGVLVYFIFALNYAVFGNTFYGIYILQIICATAFLFLSFKIVRYFANYCLSVILTAVVAVIAYTTHMYSGGAVEEFCLPLLLFGLYVFLSYIKRGGDKIALWQVALCGFFCGLIFWMKYTAMVFYCAFAVIVFVDRCLKKDVKSGFLYAAVFLAAFIVPAIPCLVYLGVNGAVGDMFEQYFYHNIFTYRTDKSQRLARLRKTVTSFALHIHMYAIAVMGVIYIFRETKLTKRFKVYSAVLLAAMILMFMLFGSNSKYHLTILMFVPFGIYPTFVYLKRFFLYIKRKRRAGKVSVCDNTQDGAEITEQVRVKSVKTGISARAYVLGAVVVAALCLVLGRNTLSLVAFKNYPQLAIAEDLEERTDGEDYTLLTYMSGDIGFYTACDTAPELKFFAKYAFTEASYPEMFAEMRGYISSGASDYVVTSSEAYNAEKELFDEGGYVIVEQYSYTRVEMNYYWHKENYVLLERQ